jgi:uncharacterized membrane protein
MFEQLIALVVLAFPVAAIVGMVMAVGARDRVRVLEARLVVLERRLDGTPAGAATPEPPRPAVPDIPEPAAPITDAAEPMPLPPEPAVMPEPAEPAIAASSPIAPPPPTAPAPPSISFEERFGTQWVVWVGGVALALGGFFMVRYSIEQGWFGPGMRIVLGALVAIALIVAGEWDRRSEQLSGITGVSNAHIPGILTAAGTSAAYADVYAAYALYGFLPPALAFVLLGVVALATLGAALLHGPALAGLGLVGAYVTPILVSSTAPDYWSLYIYLAVVTAAAFVLARIRLWRWLAITAVMFGLLWTLPGLEERGVVALTPHVFHVDRPIITF